MIVTHCSLSDANSSVWIPLSRKGLKDFQVLCEIAGIKLFLLPFLFNRSLVLLIDLLSHSYGFFQASSLFFGPGKDSFPGLRGCYQLDSSQSRRSHNGVGVCAAELRFTVQKVRKFKAKSSKKKLRKYFGSVMEIEWKYISRPWMASAIYCMMLMCFFAPSIKIWYRFFWIQSSHQGYYSALQHGEEIRGCKEMFQLAVSSIELG